MFSAPESHTNIKVFFFFAAEKHILKMNKIKKMPLKGHNNWDGHKENLYELPEFDEGESDSFKSASSKLKMR